MLDLLDDPANTNFSGGSGGISDGATMISSLGIGSRNLCPWQRDIGLRSTG